MSRAYVLVLAAGIAAGLYAADVGFSSHATAAQSARWPPLRHSGKDHSLLDCLAFVPPKKEGRELATTIAIVTAATAVTIVRQPPPATPTIAPVRFTALQKLLLATLFLP